MLRWAKMHVISGCGYLEHKSWRYNSPELVAPEWDCTSNKPRFQRRVTTGAAPIATRAILERRPATMASRPRPTRGILRCSALCRMYSLMAAGRPRAPTFVSQCLDSARPRGSNSPGAEPLPRGAPVGRCPPGGASHTTWPATHPLPCPAIKTLGVAAAARSVSYGPVRMDGGTIARFEARRETGHAYLDASDRGKFVARNGPAGALPGTEAAECTRDWFLGCWWGSMTGTASRAKRLGGSAAVALAYSKGGGPRRPCEDGTGSGRPTARGPATRLGRHRGTRHQGRELRIPCAIGSRRRARGAGVAASLSRRFRLAACAPCRHVERPARRPAAAPRAGARPARGIRAPARRGGAAR